MIDWVFRIAALWLALSLGAPALASQATLVTPGAPLPMTGLASFLNAAFLSIGSCNSGNSAPANGTGGAAFAGECWINTTANPWVFSYTPDGTHWVEFGELNTSSFIWTPYLGGNPTSETAPLSGSLASGVLTIALQYDANFTNGGSNQLAFASIASGDILANSGSASAEPTGVTPTSWLDRWCSSTQFQFPQAGASSWGCNTVSNLLIAGTGISLSGTGQVTIALGNQIAAGGPTGGAATIPVLTYNPQGQLTAVTTATSNPTQVNGNSWPSSGTSGGIPYFSGANAISSSAALTQFGFVFGGGAGNAPTSGTACTSAQIAIGQSSANPACETISGDISITAAGAVIVNKIGGVSVSLPLSVANGGWGLSTLTSGAIYKGNGTSAPTASALSDNGTIVSSTEPIDVKSNAVVEEIANASTTGTTLNALAKLIGAPSTAVITSTSDTGGVAGVVVGGAGTSGNAQIAIKGQAPCFFDGGTTAGDYVQISSTTGGDCHDAGSSYPTSHQVIGRVLSTNSGAGTYAIELFGPEIVASSGGSGGVSSVDVVAGNGLAETGTCNSTSSINCTLTAVLPPQGRLTLVSGTPVMTANETAKSEIFYDCFKGGRFVPVYNGTTDVLLSISSCEITDTMPTSGTGVTNSGGVFDEWAISVSGTLTLCHATNGSGGGWASDTSGSNTARGTGYSQLDQSTRPYITNKNSIADCYNGSTNEGSISANQATYLGTFITTAAGQTGMAYTGSASGGAAVFVGLFNAYNQVPTFAYNVDSGATYSYTTATWRASRASTFSAAGTACNCIVLVDGLGQTMIGGRYMAGARFSSSGEPEYGINEDVTSGGPPVSVDTFNANSNNVDMPGTVEVDFQPQLGLHYLQAMEIDASATGTVSMDEASNNTLYLHFVQ